MINSNACCKTREQLLKRKRKKKKTNEPRNLKWNAKKYAIQKKVGKGNKTGGTTETHSKMERTAKAKIHHRNETAQRPWTRAGENAENRQVHRGSQDPRTPGLSPRKRTAIPPAWPGLAFLHGRPRMWGSPGGCLPGSTGSLGLGKLGTQKGPSSLPFTKGLLKSCNGSKSCAGVICL